MALRCTVCDHENRAAINSLLASGAVSNRGIASQFKLNRAAVDRHAINHLPKTLAMAVERAEKKEQDDFMESIRSAMSTSSLAQSAGLQALHDGKIDPELAYRLMPSFMAQGLAATRLLGEATGRLNQAAATTTLNVLCVSIPGPPAPQASSPNVIEATSEVMPPGDTEE